MPEPERRRPENVARRHITERLDEVLAAGELVLDAFDREFPKGQSEHRPSISLYCAVENLRELLWVDEK